MLQGGAKGIEEEEEEEDSVIWSWTVKYFYDTIIYRFWYMPR
jgi:hypothetical protein